MDDLEHVHFVDLMINQTDAISGVKKFACYNEAISLPIVKCRPGVGTSMSDKNCQLF